MNIPSIPSLTYSSMTSSSLFRDSAEVVMSAETLSPTISLAFLKLRIKESYVPLSKRVLRNLSWIFRGPSRDVEIAILCSLQK